MRWYSWLFGKKVEEPPEPPPEPLVLGATLRCRYGSHDSFLHVNKENIDINHLPGACVDDCIALENILSFGNCHVGHLCELKMEIEGRWENPEPQKTMINGKEIITTKSILKCRAAAEEFEIIKSGQDGIYAKQILLIRDMQKKYPGLLEILEDQYSSLYLQEGMYEKGLKFLEDRMITNGGEIEIITMYANGNLEGQLMLATMERLLVDCDTKSFEVFMKNLTDTECENNMDNEEGWNKNYLNATMMELFKKDCKETAKMIETNPMHRAAEKHKMFGSWLAESTNAMSYSMLLYYSGMSEMKYRKGKYKEEESNIEGVKKQDNAAGIKEGNINNKGSGGGKTAIKGASEVWDMPRGGGTINGRKYSEHAMERMAPDTPAVRAELHTRAMERAKVAGLKPGTVEYNTFVNKQVDPRGIPPQVIDDAINNIPANLGKYPDTFIHQSSDATVIVNGNGDVITVIPK